MLKKLFASLIVLVVLPLTLVLSLLYGLFETYLDPDFYQDEETIDQIYSGVADLMVGTLSSTEMEAGKTLGDYVDVEEIIENIQELLPAESIVEITGSVIDQIDQIPMPDEIVIDISEIKEKLPEAASETMVSYIDGLETCTAEQEAIFGTEEMPFPTCIPSFLTKDDVMSMVGAEEFSVMFDDFPNDYKVAIGEVTPELEIAIQVVLNQNWLIKAAIIALYVVLLALIALIIFRPVESVLFWIGNTLFWGALPMACMDLTMQQSTEKIIPLIAQYNSAINMEQINSGLQMFTLVTGFVTEKMFVHGIVLCSTGIALWIIGLIIKLKKK